MTALPLMAPPETGENVTLSWAVWPGESIRPLSGGLPDALRPAPEMLSEEIVVVLEPLELMVTERVDVVPMGTLPKLRLEGVQLIAGEEDVTVSVAEELVTLPALLLTTTANVEPLSEAVVAGVV